MTPEQEERFHLVNTPGPTVNISGQVTQAGMPVESVEVNIVSEGLERAMSYMSKNGPLRPIQRFQAPKITQQQLEEQKMNEAQGLPSNLDEASRVVALEKTVSNLNSNMAKITDLLEKALQSQSVLEQPPIRQGKLVDRPPYSPRNLNPIVVENRQYPVSIPSVLATETQIPEDERPISLQGFCPQPSPPPASPETIVHTKEYDGMRIAEFDGPNTGRVAPVTLGPTGSTGPDSHEDRYELTDESSPGEAEEVIDEPTPPPVDVAEMKRLSRQQMLTDQVTDWLKSKDTHKFWRQFIAGACNKNLSYNTWPPEFTGPFDKKFKSMVADPSFVSVMCGRITKMQMGHLVSPHVAGAFVVATAGFLSFALLDT